MPDPRSLMRHRNVEATYSCQYCGFIIKKLTIKDKRAKNILTKTQFYHWMSNKDIMIELLKLESVNGRN